MGQFSAEDGTMLAYEELGDGEPVVCLPGGPMQDARYLGDLGGLGAHCGLIPLELRGTGRSAVPDDSASYRCDRLVADVESLRVHLELDQVNLLGHSAGTNLAVLYAAQHPERVRRLVLVNPSTAALGVDVPASARREAVLLRKDEPWFPAASAALETITGGGGEADDWDAIAPFFYGRWDAAARAHNARGESQRNAPAAAIFGTDGAFDPSASRTALARFDAPVLVVAGEVDVNSPPSAMVEVAHLFTNARLVVLPGTGHFAWLDRPEEFVATTAGFLADAADPADVADVR